GWCSPGRGISPRRSASSPAPRPPVAWFMRGPRSCKSTYSGQVRHRLEGAVNRLRRDSRWSSRCSAARPSRIICADFGRASRSTETSKARMVRSNTAGVKVRSKEASATIPIVFGMAQDPVRLGLVASLARPGGNLTGINFLLTELAAKRLELLHEMVPAARRLAVLVNPTQALNTEGTLQEVQA